MCALSLFYAAAAAQQQSVVSSPHVAGLTCDPATKQHSVVVGFSVQPSIPGSTYLWTFSGCGATPSSSTQERPLVTFSTPGEATANVTVTIGNDVHQYSGKVYLTGGPLLITQSGRSQDREGRVYPNSLNEWQPFILDYFNYSLRNGRPEGAQLANTIHAEEIWAQPEGTTFQWIKTGPIDFMVDPSESSTFVDLCANGPSARGGATISLVYSLTKDGHTGSVIDSSDEYRAKTSIPDPGYRKITCHKPDHVTDVGQAVDVNQQGSAPNWLWSNSDKHVMELFRQLDPFKEVEVQERFPPSGFPPTTFDDGQPLSNFRWNGNPSYAGFWTSGSTEYNLPPPNDHQPGYNYHARFTDYIGFKNWHSTIARPIGGGIDVLTFTHEYYAATESVSLSAFGIYVGRYTAKCYTDGTTHTGD